MTIEILQKIKQAAGEKHLAFLVLDQQMAISARAIAALKTFGKLYIVVGNQMELSKMSSMFPNDPEARIFMQGKEPLQNYDVIIGYALNQYMCNAIAYFKSKYILTFKAPEGVINFPGYNELEPGCWGKDMLKEVMPKLQADRAKAEKSQKLSEENAKEISKTIDEIDENKPSNYDAYIESVAPEKEEAKTPRLRYVFDQVEGRVSIVLLCNGKMGNFAANAKSIKNQNLPDYEIIVVDNAGTYKHNLKVNLKYAKQVPSDYAADRGRELTTGSYIFILDQDAECPDINAAIDKGDYLGRD